MRLTLSALGADEFGIFLASAGVGLFLGFLTGSMTIVSQRALSMAAERRDREFTKLVMAACLKNHLILGSVFLLLGEIFGHAILLFVLKIPADRLTAAIYVLHFTIAAGAIGIIAALFEAFLWSREEFVLFSAINVVNAIFTFLIALSLPHITGDRLFFYGAAVCAANAALMGIAMFVVLLEHPETRTLPKTAAGSHAGLVDRRMFYWNSLGSLSYLGQQQGLSYLLFYFYGPAVSASFAVAGQVQSLFRQIGQAVNSALAPGLYRMEAAGSRDRMVGSALIGSQYLFLLLSLGLVPAWFEAPFLLRIWLVKPPEGAALLAQALLAALALDLLSSQAFTAWQAIGDVSRLFLASAVLTALGLFGCVLAGAAGGPLEIVALIAVSMGAANAVLRILLLEKHARGVTARWLSQIALPSLIAVVPSAICAAAISATMDEGFPRLGVSLIVCSIVGVGSGSLIVWRSKVFQYRKKLGELSKNFRFLAANIYRTPIETIKTVAAPLTNEELFARWSRAENLLPEWDERTTIIAELLPAGADVIEFGAGRMVLKALLPKDCRYQPSDIVARSEDTLVCDLNKEAPALTKTYSHAVFSGVLEYVRSVPRLAGQIAPHVETVIASYSTVERLPDFILRKRNGWVSHLTEEEFLAAFNDRGFALQAVRTWREQNIYVLGKVNGEKGREPSVPETSGIAAA